MTGPKDRELAEAVWLLKQAGLQEAAQLLARVWAADGPGSRRGAREAGRRRTVKVWLPRARQWMQLPADLLPETGGEDS